MAVLTLEVVPLNFTTLSLVIMLKWVPLIVTVVATGPDVGEKEVIVGAGSRTTNSVSELATLPPIVTDILPVVAAGGTMATICVAVAEVTDATSLLNFTRLSAAAMLKLVPVMVTELPGRAEAGVKETMVGLGFASSLFLQFVKKTAKARRTIKEQDRFRRLIFIV